jgi:RHS repeat-associated protein
VALVLPLASWMPSAPGGSGAPEAVTAAAAAPAAAQPPGGLVESAKQFGSTEGAFSVGEDGTARYRVPLWTSPGRGGLQPKLSLAYGSRAGNGVMGVGWSLDGLPQVTRCSRTPAQDGIADGIHWDASDVFCLNGERLQPATPAGRDSRQYRTERESFARITAHGMQDGDPDYFQVHNKDGRILTFGQSPIVTRPSKLRAYRLKINRGQVPDIEPASDDLVTVAWALDRIQDRNGNDIRIDYTHYAGYKTDRWGASLRPNSVSYAPNRQIRFSYELRPDHVDRFVGGVHLRTIHRLAGIGVYDTSGAKSELLREYKLSYLTHTLTGRSVLSTVTELDPDGVSKLPQTFSYHTGSSKFDVVDTNVPFPDMPAGARQPTLLVGDINGDGRDDLLYRNKQMDWNYRLSNGSGFGAETDAGIGRLSPTEAGQVRTVDFDRNGTMDVLAEVRRARPPGAPYVGNEWVLYHWNGTRFVSYPEDVDENTADDAPDPAYFADLDGNGMPDYLTATWDPKHSTAGPWYYRLNTGKPNTARWQDIKTTSQDNVTSVRGATFDVDGDSRGEIVGWNGKHDNLSLVKSFGMSADGAMESATAEVNIVGSAASRHFADINGDNLRDVVYPYNGLRAQLNTGNGFTPLSTSPAGYTLPPRPSPTRQSEAVNIADLNGDGAQDVLVMYGERAELWVWKNDTFARQPMFGLSESYLGSQSRLLDVDGGGASDVLTVEDGRLRILRRTLGAPEVMVSAGPPVGRRTEVSYATLADRNVHTPCEDPTYPQICMASGSRVVSQHRIAIPAAPNGWAKFDHDYRGARMDVRGRGFLGFAEHKVTDQRSGEQTVTSFDNVTRVGGTDGQTEVYPYAQLPKQVTTTVPEAERPSFRRVTTYEHAARRTTGGGYAVELTETTESEQEKTATSSSWGTYRVRTSTMDYDELGNLTEVSGGPAFGRRTTVKTTYENDEATWLIGRKKTEVTRACRFGDEECTEREVTYDYDENGNLTETVRQPDDADLELRTTVDYGEAGTVKSVTTADSEGEERTESFSYDDDLLMPTSVTNALDQTTTMKVHSGLGVVLERTDPNGVKTTMRYDGFGRLRETNEADGDFERIGHVSFLGMQMISTSRADGSGAKVYVDPFGRTVKNATKTFDGKFSTVNLDYDAFDQLASESRASASGDSSHKTTYSYDKRGRLTSRRAPDGVATRYSYDKLATTVTDGRGVQSTTVRNLDGLVAERLEDDPASSGKLETAYSYGPFGELTKVVAPGGTQTMSYDDLGRRTRHTDPSAGVMVSAHDAFGQLTSETNGAGEETTFSYDDLGRVTKVVSPGGTATNRWDTAANGIGRLASATSADGVPTRYAYDDLGRTTTATWTVENQAYEVGYGYDDIGRQSSITYPHVPGVAERLRVDYGYNAAGYLNTVKNAADGKAYWTAEERNADGRLTRERFGNELVGSRSYQDSTGLLRWIMLDDSDEAGYLHNITYDYDLNRNVTRRYDVNHKRWEVYGYDELNRLESWRSHVVPQVTGFLPAEGSFTYDKAGNLVAESLQIDDRPEETTTYRYGENDAPRNAMTSRNDAAYTYDEAGRQTGGPGRTVEYNALGLPVEITGSSAAERTELRYDAGGSRILKRGPGETVVSLAGLFERRVAGGAVHNVHHIVADGRTVADVTLSQSGPSTPATASVSYLHPDLQNSTVMVTGADGKPLGGEEAAPGAMFYDPFGRPNAKDYEPLADERRDGPRQGYTGHGSDAELGLVDMRGRVYEPTTRRFLTPDPFVPDPMAGQSYNRYSYVRNNPATLVDPSGFQEKREDCNDCVGNEVIIVPPVEIPPDAGDLFDFGGWMRGWGPRGPSDGIGRGGFRVDFGGMTMREYINSLPAPPTKLELLNSYVEPSLLPLTVGPFAVTTKDPAISPFKLEVGLSPTGGPSITYGGGLSAGSVTLTATSTSPAGTVSATASAKGPSLGLNGAVDSKGGSVTVSASAGSVEACTKACAPIFKACLAACFGLNLGASASASASTEGVGVKASAVLQGGFKGTYEGTEDVKVPFRNLEEARSWWETIGDLFSGDWFSSDDDYERGPKGW